MRTNFGSICPDNLYDGDAHEDGSHSRLGRINVRTNFGSIYPGFPVMKGGDHPLGEVFERTAVIRDSAESMCERNFGSICPGFPVTKEGDHPLGEVFEERRLS